MSFLAVNKITAIIRAHEVQQEGYRYHFTEIMGDGKSQARIMPPVITIFSAPNYCGRYGNLGAYLKVTEAPKSTKQQTGFKPIDLLEPVQFEAVTAPMPLVLESEVEKQNNRIVDACPYMPTTFSAFLTAVLTLSQEEGGDIIIEEEVAIGDRVPDMEEDHRRRGSIEKGMCALRIETAQKELAMSSVPLTTLLGVLPRMEKSYSKRLSFQGSDMQGNGSVKSLIQKYNKSKASDGISEMHPELIRQKQQQARAALAKGGEGLMKTKSGGTRITLHGKKNRGPVSMDQEDEEVSIFQQNNIESKSSLTGDVDVEFSTDELLALQTLHLIIDRDGDGRIDVNELIRWSQETGYAVQKFEAQKVIDAVDEDKDGQIGFADYLSFAAIMKQTHQMNKAKEGNSPAKNPLANLLKPI